MFRNKSASSHAFAMVPRADVPRSSFNMQKTLKTCFDAGYLVPIFCEEVLPGDFMRLKMTAFGRLATPIYPVMDNLWLETFFFFVPNRLVWNNWAKFCGEQANPGDSISYTIPQQVCPAGGYAVGSLQDFFGLPTVGQVGGGATVSHSALPLRGYNLIFNEWFRDQNINSSLVVDKGDGPDTVSNYVIMRRNKRHDYFTGALPWPQKGGTSVSLPLGTTAPVIMSSANTNPVLMKRAAAGHASVTANPLVSNTSGQWDITTGAANIPLVMDPNGSLLADLSSATASTVNQLRQSFQIQKLLERDVRGGTRYTELIRSHFGVASPDGRLQRPEYLGGGRTAITLHPIAQTSGSGASGTTTPQGNLSAMGTYLAPDHGFSSGFVEHGYVIGLVNVRADLTYQQGLRRHWSRSTRYDYYWPAFAMLGEQSILNKEIYCDGSGNDMGVFGYQERWAEYRYCPSEITSLMRSTAASTIDPWHLSQKFTALPTLNTTFMFDTPPLSRILAVGSGANGKQLLCDAFFDIKATRPLPMYSVPGLIDHF